MRYFFSKSCICLVFVLVTLENCFSDASSLELSASFCDHLYHVSPSGWRTPSIAFNLSLHHISSIESWFQEICPKNLRIRNYPVDESLSLNPSSFISDLLIQKAVYGIFIMCFQVHILAHRSYDGLLIWGSTSWSVQKILKKNTFR